MNQPTWDDEKQALMHVGPSCYAISRFFWRNAAARSSTFCSRLRFVFFDRPACGCSDGGHHECATEDTNCSHCLPKVHRLHIPDKQ